MNKRHFFTILLSLVFCATLSAQSVQENLENGKNAESQGNVLEALTYYMKACTADKSLAEAEKRMTSMLETVIKTDFSISEGSNPATLLKKQQKLRDDWDVLLRTATEFIASNPPVFEAYYFDTVSAKELTEENYQNKTMSFTTGLPYLKEYSDEQNQYIIDMLSATLNNVKNHENWGEKINKFPWSYVDEMTEHNWLKWIRNNSVWGETRENKKTDVYPFIVKLLDKNENELAKKELKLFVSYDTRDSDGMDGVVFTGRISGFDISSDNTGKFDKGYWEQWVSGGTTRFEGEVEYIEFKDIPFENLDINAVHVSVEYSGDGLNALYVQKAPKNAFTLTMIQNQKTDEKTVKIVGKLDTIPNQYKSNRPRWEAITKNAEKIETLDLSETSGLQNIYYGYLPSHVIYPNSIDKISLGYRIAEIPTSIKEIEKYYRQNNMKIVVNYHGTESQWNMIKGHELVPKDIKINYSVGAEKRKAERTAAVQRLTDLRRPAIEAKAREEAERLAAEQERIAVEQKAEEERKIAAQKAEQERKTRLAGYVAHPEIGVPFEYVPYVIRGLKSDAKIRVTGKVPKTEKKYSWGDVSYLEDFSSIARAIRGSKVKIHLDLSALDFNAFCGDGYSFENCEQLSGITIPSIYLIWKNSFKNCTSLKIVNFCGSKKEWKQILVEHKSGNEALLKAKIKYNYKGE